MKLRSTAWTTVALVLLATAGWAQTERPLPFSITATLIADLGLDLPQLDDEGRLLSSAHLGVNPGMVHLAYRRYFAPLERSGRGGAFWAAGVLVPFSRPGLVLRYNYVSLGIERFVTPRIYVGGQVHFSPGMLYHVLYEPPDNPGSMDVSFLFVVVPSFYVGFTLF